MLSPQWPLKTVLLGVALVLGVSGLLAFGGFGGDVSEETQRARRLEMVERQIRDLWHH